MGLKIKKKYYQKKKQKRTAKEVEKWFLKKGQKPTKFIYKSAVGSVIYMKSSWEVRYAKWLDLQGLKWYYEPWGVNTGYGYYFPDFYLPAQEKLEKELYIEVKGRWTATAIRKMASFKKLYPDTEIKIIEAKEMKDIPK